MTVAKTRFFPLLILFCGVLTAGYSEAITVGASPNPATTGQNVTVSISATFTVGAGAPNCTIQAGFGDGSPVIDVGTCVSSPCSLSVNRAYATAGKFTITARSKSGACLTAPVAPDPATTTITVQTPPAVPTVTPVPSSFGVARGQSSSVSTNYRFTGPDGTLVSPGGSFMIGAETIEVNSVPLSVTIVNGRASVTEVITVPVRVLERALERGMNKFIYARNFGGPATNLAAAVNFAIRSEAAADFEIKRIELYFKNRRTEATIERNERGLRAYADIRFSGSGLLQGHWEVDGRVLSTVNRHLAFGASVTLQTPGIPPLPTFDAGSHSVRFVITSPVTTIPLPSIQYFVKPKDVKGKPGAIRLLFPKDDAGVGYAPAEFRWKKHGGTALFLVQFFERPDASPVFSAFTKKPTYTLPASVIKNIFSPGRKYYWKAVALDAENNIIAESRERSFSFRREEQPPRQ